MNKGRFPDDIHAYPSAGAVPPEVMTFTQGELLVFGTPVETDAIEQGIATTLAVYPWMRMTPAALHSFMAEVISQDTIPVIPGREVIGKRARQLATKINEAAGVELLVVEYRESEWRSQAVFELRPGEEDDRPDRSYLYNRFVDAPEIPELPKGDQHGALPFLMCTNTIAIFNGREISLTDIPLFITNVLLIRRTRYTSGSQILAYRIPPPPGAAKPETVFENERRRLERRVDRSGEPPLLVTDGRRGGVRYMLNEAVVPVDLRHDPDAALVALQRAQPLTTPARRTSRSPGSSRATNAEKQRKTYPMTDVGTYNKVIHWSEQLANVSDADVERTAAVYAEVDRELVRRALIIERLAEGLQLPLRPGDLPGMSTLTQHYDTVVGIIDGAIKASYLRFADNPNDREWRLSVVGLYLGLPAQISILSDPNKRNMDRPSELPTRYQALIDESSNAAGGREIAYIDRLCGHGKPIEPALRKCLALLRLYANETLRELCT